MPGPIDVAAMATAIVSEPPSLAFLRYEQARRELSSKRTDALRRKKLELERQKKQADALEFRRAQCVAAIEKAWERRQLVVRVSYMVRTLRCACCSLKFKHFVFRYRKRPALLLAMLQDGGWLFCAQCKQGQSVDITGVMFK